MHFNKKHANKHEMHRNLQIFFNKSEKEALSSYSDILSLNQIASYNNDLTNLITTTQKR